MGARNMVIAGDYRGKSICCVNGGLFIAFNLSGSDCVILDKYSIESYELITEESQKSASSGVMRGAVGAALLGPVGLLAGLSAKSKGTYTVAVKFKTGENSLMEIGDKEYKKLLEQCF